MQNFNGDLLSRPRMGFAQAAPTRVLTRRPDDADLLNRSPPIAPVELAGMASPTLDVEFVDFMNQIPSTGPVEALYCANLLGTWT